MGWSKHVAESMVDTPYETDPISFQLAMFLASVLAGWDNYEDEPVVFSDDGLVLIAVDSNMVEVSIPVKDLAANGWAVNHGETAKEYLDRNFFQFT